MHVRKAYTLHLVGPLPQLEDSKEIVRDMLQAGVALKHRVAMIPGFSFCDASAWLADRNGTRSKYFKEGGYGFSQRGVELIQRRLKACWSDGV